ncbi:MAG: hypothetical protein ABJP70_12000 [Erythrobacter sp.]
MAAQKVIGAALAAIGILVGTVVVSAQESRPPKTTDSQVEVSTSMGPICWAAIVEVAYQVSSRCDYGAKSASKELVEAYERARKSLGDKFLASGWSEASLQAFRIDQGGAETSTEQLCNMEGDTDTNQFLLSLAQEMPQNIEAITQQMLAIPGEPKWGTCL